MLCVGQKSQNRNAVASGSTNPLIWLVANPTLPRFCSDFFLNAQGAHASIQVASVHTHQFSCARNVAVSFFQLPLNELAVIGLGRFFKGRKTKRNDRRFFLSVRWQI